MSKGRVDVFGEREAVCVEQGCAHGGEGMNEGEDALERLFDGEHVGGARVCVLVPGGGVAAARLRLAAVRVLVNVALDVTVLRHASGSQGRTGLTPEAADDLSDGVAELGGGERAAVRLQFEVEGQGLLVGGERAALEQIEERGAHDQRVGFDDVE